MGCLPVTCQVPTIANITLVMLWNHSTHCTHAISLKDIGEIETQHGSDMVSISCNLDNVSKVKVTFSLLLCSACTMQTNTIRINWTAVVMR